ncbi:MAG TPA: hypothetical protein VFN74_12685 [Chloroflexota bacterium]|nr:hypothetical protein [Chloroflexota bacterium]
MFVGTMPGGPLEDQSLVYATADPNQYLFVQLLAPGFKEIGGYLYAGRAEIPKGKLDAIDRLAAAKMARKRAEN